MNIFMIRRLIALTAAYAIAVQAVWGGFAALAMSAPAASEICASPGAYPTPAPAPRQADCGTCPTLCHGGGADGIPPPALATVLAPAVARAIDQMIAFAAPRSAPHLRPPSRAPPAV